MAEQEEAHGLHDRISELEIAEEMIDSCVDILEAVTRNLRVNLKGIRQRRASAEKLLNEPPPGSSSTRPSA